MGKRLVFVGGGHAHLTCLKNLYDFKKLGHQVTVVSSSSHHYYSGMGPGMLSGIYRPQEVRFHVRKMAEDREATFKEGKVVKIDPDRHLLSIASGEEVPYDVVSFNTGSDVPLESLTPVAHQNVFPVKPVINLLQARQQILETLTSRQVPSFVVIGGGAAGLEVSANLWRFVNDARGKGRITVIAGKRLMGDAPDKVRSLAMDSFSQRGVEVIEGSYAKSIEAGTVVLNDGKRVVADLIFVAVGIKPSSLFRDSGLPTGKDGGLLVNSYLQSVAYPEIFGGGDCISLEGHALAKVGVYAVRENPILYHNLIAALEGGELKAFKPQSVFLLIFNMGNGRGIFWKKKRVWEGRLAFLLKDYIDRSFMKKFQVSGELDEEWKDHESL